MNLLEAIREYNPTKGRLGYQYGIKTRLGMLGISLNGNHLCTNFVDEPIRAKLLQGHWKNNRFVETIQDIKTHIDGILKTAELK